MNTWIGNVCASMDVVAVARDEIVAPLGRTTSIGECGEGEKNGEE